MYWFVAHDVHMSVVSIVDIAVEFELFYLVSVVWKETQRERDRNKERQTERERQRQRETERERETETKRETHRETETLKCIHSVNIFFLLHN